MPLPGVHTFVGSRIVHARLGKLSLNVFNLAQLTNEAWVTYLEGTLRVADGDFASVTLVHFVEASSTSAHRKLAADFLRSRGIPDLERIALMTDSDMLRGALTAYGWLQPKLVHRAFAPPDYPRALAWLAEAAEFDRASAAAVWRSAYLTAGAKVPGTRSLVQGG
jgi:hypothetical protein